MPKRTITKKEFKCPVGKWANAWSTELLGRRNTGRVPEDAGVRISQEGCRTEKVGNKHDKGPLAI